MKNGGKNKTVEFYNFVQCIYIYINHSFIFYLFFTCGIRYS